jgi:hypothetical protein
VEEDRDGGHQVLVRGLSGHYSAVLLSQPLSVLLLIHSLIISSLHLVCRG